MAEGPAADPGAASFRRAVALLDGLTSGRLAHVVISPGSRSTPLALAAARGTGLAVHVAADERSAAFFALGLARASGRPAAVVATSGSAPAHWLPAVIEASEDEQPLVMISADRPPELVGCGANQSTEQAGLFDDHARDALHLSAEALPAHARDVGRRAALACRWPRPGPVHVNIAFREPMTPADEAGCTAWEPACATVDLPLAASAGDGAVRAALAALAGRRGAILAGRLEPGSDAIAATRALAEALDCPILADPLSGLRSGDVRGLRVLVHGDAFLRSPDAPTPQWLIRVGAPPVSKHLEAWAGACAETLVLARSARWPDPSRTATQILPGDPAATLRALADEAARTGVRAGPWSDLDELDAARARAVARLDELPREAELMAAIADAAPAGTPVFFANSLVVRDADSFLPGRVDALPVYGNRGVSGIDGNVATAAGIVAANGQAGLAVVGDVALFHDLNSLALAARLPLVVIVINNGGGAIFRQLDQATLPEFEALWLTPPPVDFGAAAAAFGMAHRRLQGHSDLPAELAQALASQRPALLELVVDREASALARERWWAAGN